MRAEHLRPLPTVEEVGETRAAFAARVRELRRAAGYTQYQFARVLGVNSRAIWSWEAIGYVSRKFYDAFVKWAAPAVVPPWPGIYETPVVHGVIGARRTTPAPRAPVTEVAASQLHFELPKSAVPAPPALPQPRRAPSRVSTVVAPPPIRAVCALCRAGAPHSHDTTEEDLAKALKRAVMSALHDTITPFAAALKVRLAEVVATKVVRS